MFFSQVATSLQPLGIWGFAPQKPWVFEIDRVRYHLILHLVGFTLSSFSHIFMCLPYSGTACPIETNTTKPELPKICWNWAMISGRPGTQQGQSRKTYGFNHFLWASMGAPENDIYHQKKSVLVRNMMRNQLNKWQLRPSCFQTYQLRYLKPIKSHKFVLVEYLTQLINMYFTAETLVLVWGL